MARTTTTRLGISKPTPGTDEMVDPGVDVGTNWDKVDAAVGAHECTEATKPATPWDNQLIRTSDTRRVYIWNTVENVWDFVGVYLDGIGSEQIVYKTEFQNRISTTTLTDVTELKFAGLANAKYTFSLDLFVVGSINGDVKIGFTFPIGAEITWFSHGPVTATTTQLAPLEGAGYVESTITDQVQAYNAHGNGVYIHVEGYIKFGVNAGDLQLRFAQNVSNATATSIREGSNLRWIRVA